MRIAFLCKRRYMGKDVIADRYARLYEIPNQLARHGHSVLAICTSYQRHDDGTWRHSAPPPGKLVWKSRSVFGLRELTFPFQPYRVLSQLRHFVPDVVIGASDIPHVALAAWLAKRLRIPYAVDLYDNFEGFGQARIPGMVAMLRRAVREADLVTTTSEPLADLVRDGYGARGNVVAMPSTIDKNIFRPQNRLECRRQLGLPLHSKLVGTAGGLYKAKGVDTLYEAWSALAARDADVHLIVAGPVDKALRPPQDKRVHYCGELPHAKTALLFNALDVGVIYIRDTIFGRYCFPQKAYEMLACGLPIVAANVGAIGQLLAEWPECLYGADDAEDLAAKVNDQLAHPVMPNIEIKDWGGVVRELEPQLQGIANRQSAYRV